MLKFCVTVCDSTFNKQEYTGLSREIWVQSPKNQQALQRLFDADEQEFLQITELLSSRNNFILCFSSFRHHPTLMNTIWRSTSGPVQLCLLAQLFLTTTATMTMSPWSNQSPVLPLMKKIPKLTILFLFFLLTMRLSQGNLEIFFVLFNLYFTRKFSERNFRSNDFFSKINSDSVQIIPIIQIMLIL